MGVRRIYVEKKPEFAVRARELKEAVVNYLGIRSIDSVRVLIRYDIEDMTDRTYEKSCSTIFSEPPLDDLYEETFPTAEGDAVFTVEYLPGQFDQRADSAVQCVKLINENSRAVIRSATTYGLGVEQSRDKAMGLYRLAAALGSEEAQRQLAILGD